MPPRGSLSERRQVIQEAQIELRRQPLYLDTETTGLEGTDEIVEICLLDHDGTVLVESFVKPKRRIPPDVVRIHGITNEMVKGAPAWPEVWEQVAARLGGKHVIIYNADFDVRLMQQSHAKYGMPWNLPADPFCCAMKLYARFYGEWNYRYGNYRWHSLEAAAQQCGIPLPPQVHRAREDAELARQVVQYMAKQKG